MRDFNWNDLRFFVALARTGNAAAAARLLRVDHNTVRRRVSGLEADLHTKLFDHRDDSQVLTDAGEKLLMLAERIEGDVAQVHSVISGQDVAVSGTVRLGVPDGFGTIFIAPRLGKLRQLHPSLNVELMVTSRGFNLSKREADMAIYIDRPTQGRMTIKKVGDVALRLYASRSYLERFAPIEKVSDLDSHDFLSGMDGLDFGPSLNDAMSISATIRPCILCSSSVGQLKATAGGAGLCLFSRFIAETEPDLVPVLPDQISLVREIWLAFHTDFKDLARVRAVAEFITREFAEAKELFS